MSPNPGTDSLSLFASPTDKPGLELENELFQAGKTTIAGVDEAGRGPLAGPVVAAAVVLNPDNLPDGIDDSKKLSASRRIVLFDAVIASAGAVSWAAVNALTIDDTNIRLATLDAMERAVSRLTLQPDWVLFDGRDVPEGKRNCASAVVGGDAKSLSIAAASIVAKVVRDRMMARACKYHPAYGFSGHKGYGSRGHRQAIEKYGPCKLHRFSFSPIRERSSQP